MVIALSVLRIEQAHATPLKIYVRGEHGSMFPGGGGLGSLGGNMTYVSLVLTNQK